MLYLQSQFVEFGDPIYNIEGFWAHRYPIPKRDFLKVSYKTYLNKFLSKFMVRT